MMIAFTYDEKAYVEYAESPQGYNPNIITMVIIIFFISIFFNNISN